VLPAEVNGDVVMRIATDGTVALEGWVASLDGHRGALEIARNSSGPRRLDDRVVIVLGRQV
jgi:hypothetical protein